MKSGAAWKRMDYTSSRATHQAFTLFCEFLSEDEADWTKSRGFILNSERRKKVGNLAYTSYNSCSMNTLGQV